MSWTWLLGMLFLINASLSFAEPYKIIGDDDFPPFSFVNERGELTGIDIDILRGLEKRLNIQFDIELVPWKRLLLMTEQGLVAGSFSLFDTEARRRFSLYTHPLHYSTYKLFVKQGDQISFDSFEDLYGKRIGVQAGFAISGELDKASKAGQIELIELFSFEELYKRLQGGGLDAVVGNELLFKYNLKQNRQSSSNIVMLDKALTRKKSAYFVLSKASDLQNKLDMQAMIKKELLLMEEEGVYQQIVSRYID